MFEIIKSLGLFENRMRGLRDVTSRFLRMPRFIIGSLPSFCSLFFRFPCIRSFQYMYVMLLFKLRGNKTLILIEQKASLPSQRVLLLLYYFTLILYFTAQGWKRT